MQVVSADQPFDSRESKFAKKKKKKSHLGLVGVGCIGGLRRRGGCSCMRMYVSVLGSKSHLDMQSQALHSRIFVGTEACCPIVTVCCVKECV